jgi:hypothetical protein
MFLTATVDVVQLSALSILLVSAAIYLLARGKH